MGLCVPGIVYKNANGSIFIIYKDWNQLTYQQYIGYIMYCSTIYINKTEATL